MPGGPYRITPLGCAMPRDSKSSGCLMGSSTTSLISFTCWSRPPIMSKVLSGTFSTCDGQEESTRRGVGRSDVSEGRREFWRVSESGRTGALFFSPRRGEAHLHEGHERVDQGGEDGVQSVAVVLQRHARAGDELGDVDVLADIHDVLALGVHLDRGGRGAGRVRGATVGTPRTTTDACGRGVTRRGGRGARARGRRGHLVP